MGDDSEIEAMATLARVLDVLDDGAKRRILAWAASRFGAGTVPEAPVLSARSTSENLPEFTTFAELMDAADPATDRARALVAAYWAQVCEGQPGFAAQSLNANLKDLGHRLSNITVSLEGLKAERPALILQLKKDGKSRQARKTYKLTVEGARRVRAMIAKEEI